MKKVLFSVLLLALAAFAFFPPPISASPQVKLSFTNPADGGNVQVLAQLSVPDVPISTWGISVRYDQTKYEFISAQPTDNNYFGELIIPEFKNTVLGRFGHAAGANQKVFMCENIHGESTVTVGGSTLGQSRVEFSGTTAVSLVFRQKAAVSGDGKFEVVKVSLIDISGRELTPIIELPPAYRGLVVSNSPNPFNPSTQITYSLPDAGNVTVKVYNSIGQLARTLVNGYKTAGQHSVSWDGADETGRKAASGVYICEAVAGELKTARHMVLLK